MNPHVLSDTRSLVLPVCQFQHSRATRCILAQRKAVGNNFFSFFFFVSGTFSLPSTDWGLTPSWHRYVAALSAMGSDPPWPLGSLRERQGSGPIMAPVRGRFICDGVRPPDRPIVYGTGSWSDPHGLPLILFCFRRGRLRVLRGELRLAGLDVLLDGLLRAFVDGTALLTAEGLHQAHVVGV